MKQLTNSLTKIMPHIEPAENVNDDDIAVVISSILFQLTSMAEYISLKSVSIGINYSFNGFN
jgi:hypothetical protein